MIDLQKSKRFYKDLINFCKSNNRYQLDIEDKVYTNFLTAIYPMVNSNPYYCDDFLFFTVDRCILEDCAKTEIDEKRVEEIIKLIHTHFEINKARHYLLIPLQGAKLNEDIVFGKFFFLKSKTEDEIKIQISQITNIEASEIDSFLEHTKNSRSPDFLVHPLVIVEIENQTSNVDNNAVNVAQGIVKILKLIHYKEEFQNDFMLQHLSEWYKDNHHVAIISTDTWRCGHRCWWKRMVCKIDISFIKEKKHQENFEKMLNDLIIQRRLNELEYKFYNALELFQKSLEQVERPNDDVMLSLLLLFSAAESLLTEGDNEKKLRLCVIWPRIVEFKGYSVQQLANIVKNMYEKRNDFVHAGQVQMFSEESDDSLVILQQMLAKLIFKYIELNTVLDISDGSKPINAWKKFIKNIFEDAVYRC